MQTGSSWIALQGALWHSIDKEMQKNRGILCNNVNIDDRKISVSVGEKPAKKDAKEVCSGMDDKELYNTIGFIPANKSSD